MKSRASLLLIVSLIAGPSIGCATVSGPRFVDPDLPGGAAAAADWSRVREITPAAQIVVTLRSLQPISRYFVQADDSAVIVLNLTDPTLPGTSTRILRDMAARHPDFFAAMQEGRAFAEGNVRVGRDGLFVANRKVAELGAVVETLARSDVSEILGPVKARGSVPGAILGGWLGFVVGALPALGGASEAAAWSVLIGSTVVGGWLGFEWSSHKTEGVVYRTP